MKGVFLKKQNSLVCEVQTHNSIIEQNWGLKV